MNVTLVACQLIPLEKSPGVTPIVVGEVLRRNIGEAIMTVLKLDIINVNSYHQSPKHYFYLRKIEHYFDIV